MIKSILGGSAIIKRLASTGTYQGQIRTSLPRRPMKKIKLGKARPAIYHQFNVAVELSDGSIVMRKSQYPKDELRLIQDQRNNPLWNESRDDLIVIDANSAGSIDKFKQKYGAIFSAENEAQMAKSAHLEAAQANNKSEDTEQQDEDIDTKKETDDSADSAALDIDDYLSLLDDSSQQIKTGKVASKKKAKK